MQMNQTAALYLLSTALHDLLWDAVDLLVHVHLRPFSALQFLLHLHQQHTEG